MKLFFAKMQGCGNDYIFLDMMSSNPIYDPSGLSRKLCDRHFGIGGDGIVLILPSVLADASMRMFNSDGSEGMMCGNAIRCVGKYLHENGYTSSDTVLIETASGIKSLKLFQSLECDAVVDSVAVDVGMVKCAPELICQDLRERITPTCILGGVRYRINAVSVGNPHCVIFVDDIDLLDLEVLGREIEYSEIFTERVNVEFVKVVGSSDLRVRVWERGSGETFSCGTGACAAAFVACINEYCSFGTEICVQMRGGKLSVACEKDGRTVLRGDAVHVFSGVTEVI